MPKKEQKPAKVHFATSDYTACDQYIANDENTWDEEDGWDFADPNVQHTCDPDFVTCKKCKDSNKYKQALEESRAAEAA